MRQNSNAYFAIFKSERAAVTKEIQDEENSERVKAKMIKLLFKKIGEQIDK